jgi:DNA-binding transcriptional ArsR family regulator
MNGQTYKGVNLMQREEIVLSKELLKKSAKMFKILGDPTRLAILHLLADQELNVGTISNVLEMEQSAISHQLKLLKANRLVKSRRSGRSMIYSQNDDHVYHIVDQMITHVKEEKSTRERI